MATPLNVKKIQTLVNKFGDNLKQSNEQQVVHSLEQLIKDLTNEKNFFLNYYLFLYILIYFVYTC